MASLTSSSRPASIPTSGKELMLELKRTTNITSNTDGGGDFLAPYNAQLVRKCFQDVQRSFQTLREEMQAVQMQGGGSGGGGGGGGESKSQDYNDNNSDNEEDDDDDDDVENNNSNSNNNNNNNNNSNSNANTNANTNEKKPSMSARPSILLHNATIERQKRCLLTYHKHRMDRIQDMVANNNSGQQEDNLFSQHNNAHEAEFANDYQQLREQYASEYGLELNILPPTSHMVQVKVVEDLLTKLGGPVVLDSGRSVSLTKGSRWYLPRSDVLEYLQAGSMELCDGEEVDF